MEDCQGTLKIIGVDVGFDQGFVVVELEGMRAIAEDAEHVCGESEVAVTGCCCEDVETHARGRI